MPKSQREAEAAVDEMFINRWSPIAFSSTPVERQRLESLFEAARWAPSSYNEQPWVFVYGDNEESLQKLRPLLVDGNRTWADKAPILLFVFAKKRFDKNGKENSCAEFDCGAATMSLILQGEKLGLKCHAMAGFHEDQAYEVLGVPAEDYKALCAIAIGEYGSIDEYPESLQQREDSLSSRKSFREFAYKGSMAKK